MLTVGTNGSQGGSGVALHEPHASAGAADTRLVPLRAFHARISRAGTGVRAAGIVTNYGSCLVPRHLGLIKWFPTVIEAAHKIFLN